MRYWWLQRRRTCPLPKFGAERVYKYRPFRNSEDEALIDRSVNRSASEGAWRAGAVVSTFQRSARLPKAARRPWPSPRSSSPPHSQATPASFQSSVRSSAATNAILSTHRMATSSSDKRMIKTSRRPPVCLRSRVSPTRRYPERSRVPESSRLVLLSVDRAGMVQ